MAECEIQSKYEMIKVTPDAAKTLGDMEAYGGMLGFYLTEFTATQLANSEEATLIIKGEKVKVTKKSGEAWTAGQFAYWDNSNEQYTVTFGDSVKCVGCVSENVVSAATSGWINFFPVPFLQHGLELGTSSSKLTIVASDPLLNINVTSATASGMIHAGEVNLTLTGTSAVNTIEAFTVTLTSDVQTGSWANVIFGKLDYSNSGEASGIASVFCGEMDLPGTDIPSGGVYQMIELEINCPDSCSMNGRPIDVIGVNVWGDQKAQFDTVGNLFHISGVTSGSGKFWYENAVTFNNCDAFLRINVNETAYYIPVSDNQAGT